jgi:hypothetical protein
MCYGTYKNHLSSAFALCFSDGEGKEGSDDGEGEGEPEDDNPYGLPVTHEVGSGRVSDRLSCFVWASKEDACAPCRLPSRVTPRPCRVLTWSTAARGWWGTGGDTRRRAARPRAVCESRFAPAHKPCATARQLTGSYDYTVRIYDFHGMKADMRSFRWAAGVGLRQLGSGAHRLRAMLPSDTVPHGLATAVTWSRPRATRCWRSAGRPAETPFWPSRARRRCVTRPVRHGHR